MKLGEDEMEGLGWGSADKPDALLALRLKKSGDLFQAGEADPGLHLGCGWAAGRKDDDGLLSGDPAGLDPREAFLAGIRKNAEVNSALGKAGPVSAHGLSQPNPGGDVVVLAKDFPGSGKARFSRGKVGAEEEEVAGLHGAADPAQKRKRIQIGENPEKGEQLRGGRWEGEDGKGFRKVDWEDPLLTAGESPGGAADEGKVGVGGQQMGGRGKFSEEKRLLEPVGATEGHQGVVPAWFFTEDGGGLCVKTANPGTAGKGGAGEVDLFPEAAQGGGGIKSGGGDLGGHGWRQRLG